MADVTQQSSISHEAAIQLLDLFRWECGSRDLKLSLAIADSGGNIILSFRMDGAQLGSYGIALDKAFTAVSFQLPTSTWANSTIPGASDWGLSHTLQGRATVFPGGVPVFHAGQLIGGIGVSGTKGTVDEEIAIKIATGAGFEVTL